MYLSHRKTHIICYFVLQGFNWLYPAHQRGAHDNRSRRWVRQLQLQQSYCLIVRTDEFTLTVPSLSPSWTTPALCLCGVSTRRSLSAQWRRLTVAMATQGWSSLTGSLRWRRFRTPIPSPQVPLAVRVLLNQLFNSTHTHTNETFSQQMYRYD